MKNKKEEFLRLFAEKCRMIEESANRTSDLNFLTEHLRSEIDLFDIMYKQTHDIKWQMNSDNTTRELIKVLEGWDE